MHLLLFINLPLAVYGKESPGVLPELIAFAIIGAIFLGGGIIISKFSRMKINRSEKEKSAPGKYDKYGKSSFPEKLSNELNDLTKAAEQGNADAQFHLGSIYIYGEGADHDYSEAINWYATYEQGDVATQSHLDLRADYANSNLFKKGAKKDYKKAVKWYTKASEQGNAYAQSNLGVMYEQGQGVSQNYKEAIKWYIKATEQGAAIAQNDLGMMYRDGKGNGQDYTKAVHWFAKATKQGLADASLNLGMMYYHGYGISKDYKEAANCFAKAAEQGNLIAVTLCDELQREIDSHPAIPTESDTPLQSEKLSNDLIGTSEQEEAVSEYMSLGSKHYVNGNYQEAIEAYKQAIRIDPDYSFAHNSLGRAYLAIGDKSGALEEYEILKTLDVELANKLFYEINSTDASEEQQEVSSNKPDDANAAQSFYNKGCIELDQENDTVALTYFQKAITIKPDHASSYCNLGVVYINLGRHEEAIEACKQAIRLESNCAETHYTLGAAYFNLGHYEKAIEAFRQAIRIKPDDAETHSDLGEAYYYLDRYQEAIESYQQAIKMNPDYAQTHYGLASVYLQVKDKGSALEEYKILKTLDAGKANQLFDLIYK